MNKAAFDGLEAPVRQALLNAAAAAEARGWKASEEKTKWYTDQLAARGMKVQPPSPTLKLELQQSRRAAHRRVVEEDRRPRPGGDRRIQEQEHVSARSAAREREDIGGGGGEGGAERPLNDQPACKPGSVVPAARPGVTAIPLRRRLPGASATYPDGWIRTDPGIPAFAEPRAVPIRSCSRWGLPCRPLPEARCALTAPFHPCRGDTQRAGRSVLCGTFPGVAPAGRYPAPFVHGARTFLPAAFRHWPERPSGRLTQQGWGCSARGTTAVPVKPGSESSDWRPPKFAAARAIARFCSPCCKWTDAGVRGEQRLERREVEASIKPSIFAGRKCRWKAVTASRVVVEVAVASTP